MRPNGDRSIRTSSAGSRSTSSSSISSARQLVCRSTQRRRIRKLTSHRDTRFETLWSFLNHTEEPVFNLIGKAKQIVEWHRNHQYCGQCGQPTDVSDMDRSRKCHDCEQIFLPAHFTLDHRTGDAW
ncbi:MAG: NADH pyrophosphatase zinc ribbon domain-containing protein [Gammaproteobacteria bacterium]|nr:NADH pyrophosphatase zinc ribbon domain-containing protein [Gammaproteobacteria bacterium]